MQIKQQEERDSVRLVWNTLPRSKTLLHKAAIPQALHYSPLDHPHSSLLPHSPPQCPKCSAFMNPYNPIHIGKQNYTCCICKSTNKLPQGYFKDKDQMPEQLTLSHSSFLLARQVESECKLINYLFVIDVAVEEKQLQAIKSSVLELLDHTQKERGVGLVTFDKYVNIFDLESTLPTHLKISPNCTFQGKQCRESLFLGEDKKKGIRSKYIVELCQCRKTLEGKINSLRKVKHKGGYKGERQARAVGQALSTAISMAQILQQPTKIIFFCGGVCTVGPGKVIDISYKTQIRAINDPMPSQSLQAIKYYGSLKSRMQNNAIVIDSFIFSVEEVGLTQMLPCLKATGGLLVQHQQFNRQVFRQSFRKAYISTQEVNSLSTTVDTIIDVKTSGDIAVTSFQDIKKDGIQKFKNRFVLGSISETTTLTLGIELKQTQTDSEAFYLQFLTTFRDANNLHFQFQRVTTIRRPFISHPLDLINSFDQEAALHLLTKLAIEKTQIQGSQNARSWLDNIVIKWAKQFGKYQKGDSQSFKLPQNCRFLPQYIYYLRRNSLMRKNRSSLDEHSYLRQVAQEESTRNVLLMIQPAILSYTVEDTQAHPVALDQKYMRPETILLLDSFFNIAEWQGRNIHDWFQKGLQDTEEYAYIKQMHRNLGRDIQNLKNSRFPAPHIYHTHPGHSKQRFIKSRLGSRDEEPEQGNLSEQADIKSFTSMLIQLVVSK